jgi:hypothetical protein
LRKAKGNACYVSATEAMGKMMMKIEISYAVTIANTMIE